MASTLRPVAHDDRLSLVEHLTELRVRIVICLAAFIAATALSMVFNQTVLDVLNKPLVETVDAGNRDPIQQGAGYDQEVARVLASGADVLRAQAAATDDADLRASLLRQAAEQDRVAKLAPEISSRKPVTLGVSEPFLQTLKVSAYAGLLISLPRAADAQTVKEQDVTIKTPDGECDAYFVHPASGATAGVLVWPDILGLRPAFRQMGKRLAESGYAVLTVNPFYRMKKSPVVPAGTSRSGLSWSKMRVS